MWCGAFFSMQELWAVSFGGYAHAVGSSEIHSLTAVFVVATHILNMRIRN